MRPETNLEKLIKTMQPVLQDGLFVFHASKKNFKELLAFEPVQLFMETEGTAAILKKEIADENGLEYAFISRMITLNVYSSLEAVGFLAAITKELAHEGISVNAVSAYYHDHLFVPAEKAEQALKILESMTSS
jgi:hypothetical protein